MSKKIATVRSKKELFEHLVKLGFAVKTGKDKYKFIGVEVKKKK